jgi:hypothetical protein
VEALALVAGRFGPGEVQGNMVERVVVARKLAEVVALEVRVEVRLMLSLQASAVMQNSVSLYPLDHRIYTPVGPTNLRYCS